MTNEIKNELKGILLEHNSNLYDFVCNNYYLLTKEELKDLCKEAFELVYLYICRLDTNSEKQIREAHKDYYENLKEYTTLLED